VIDNQLELPAWRIEKKPMVMIDEIELYNKTEMTKRKYS
jgi:hypothetical protein